MSRWLCVKSYKKNMSIRVCYTYFTEELIQRPFWAESLSCDKTFFWAVYFTRLQKGLGFTEFFQLPMESPRSVWSKLRSIEAWKWGFQSHTITTKYNITTTLYAVAPKSDLNFQKWTLTNSVFVAWLLLLWKKKNMVHLCLCSVKQSCLH